MIDETAQIASSEEEAQLPTNVAVNYGDENIIHLDDMEHIRRRPGMYIGKLGDGSHSDDGIYVLIKESIDNSIDEYRMGEGKVIEVNVQEGRVRVRDYGRGIPLRSKHGFIPIHRRFQCNGFSSSS